MNSSSSAPAGRAGVVREGSGDMPYDIKYDDGEIEGVAFPEKSIYFFTV
jgi:hypothetical protein